MKDTVLRKTLAQELLNYTIGTRIPTVRELADRFQASIGAVQSVLTFFERENIFPFFL